MSITPNVTPSPEDSSVRETSSTPRWIPLLIIVLFLGLGALAYMGHSSQTQLQSDLTASNAHADLLGKQLEETNSRIAQMRGQLDVTSQKLGLTQDELARARTLAQQIKKQQEDSDSKLGAQIGQVQQETDQKIGQVSTDLTGAKGDIAATRQDLEDTKGKLTTTVGDLGVQSGLIARNQEELEALKRLGERNVFDFNIGKSKAPQRVGPVQVALKSTDPKHFRFTLTLLADDKAIEKKDRNVDEPLQFYVHGARTPYELVVFEVTKDHASGYLTTPKDSGSPASASATPAAAAPPSLAPPAKAH